MTADTESENNQPSMTNEELYAKMFPYYLSLGCSYNEFWNESAYIAPCYLDAEEYRRENRNYEMWIQGLYFHNAVSQALAMAFWNKKGNKPEGYTKHPFAFTEREKAAEYERKRQEALEWFMKGQEK